MAAVASAVVVLALDAPAALNSFRRTQQLRPVAQRPPQARELGTLSGLTPEAAQLIYELDPFDQLQADITDLAIRSHASVSVSLRELSGPTPRNWSFAGSRQYEAASSYKLPLLMDEAEQLTAGRIRTADVLCFQPGDYEPSWNADYSPGRCFTREELAYRVGKQSDNTAAHMLVRSIGGGDALNAYARARGATSSRLWIPNVTTTDDMATLMETEAAGGAGGQRAQQWLYPLLTGTLFEEGIPAGVRGSAMVVHKVAAIDMTEGDVALVQGPGVQYVLVVFENGLTDNAGWKLIASISKRISALEYGRVNYSSVAVVIPTNPEMPARQQVP